MRRRVEHFSPTFLGRVLLGEEARKSLARALGTQALKQIAHIGHSKVLFGQAVPSRTSHRRRFPRTNPYLPFTEVSEETGPPAHRHDFPEVGVVLQGRLNAVIGSTLYEIRQGDWLIVPSGVRHGEFCLETRGAYRLMWFSFCDDRYRLGTSAFSRVHGYWCEQFPVFKSDALDFDVPMEDLFRAPGQPREMLRVKMVALAAWWLKALSAPPDRAVAHPHPLVEEIRTILDSTAGRPPSRAELARRVGLSIGHLSRLFHASTGQTLRDAIQHGRIERARRYLSRPSLSVKEIAYLLGFADPQHFCHTFHRLVGVSPTVFRRRLAKQTDNR